MEDREHTFLYQDGEGFQFHELGDYDEVTLQADLVRDGAAYLRPRR